MITRELNTRKIDVIMWVQRPDRISDDDRQFKILLNYFRERCPSSSTVLAVFGIGGYLKRKEGARQEYLNQIRQVWNRENWKYYKFARTIFPIGSIDDFYDQRHEFIVDLIASAASTEKSSKGYCNVPLLKDLVSLERDKYSNIAQALKTFQDDTIALIKSFKTLVMQNSDTIKQIEAVQPGMFCAAAITGLFMASQALLMANPLAGSLAHVGVALVGSAVSATSEQLSAEYVIKNLHAKNEEHNQAIRELEMILNGNKKEKVFQVLQHAKPWYKLSKYLRVPSGFSKHFDDLLQQFDPEKMHSAHLVPAHLQDAVAQEFIS